jgi:uncharacterized protein YodC (DUF2158 family)
MQKKTNNIIPITLAISGGGSALIISSYQPYLCHFFEDCGMPYKEANAIDKQGQQYNAPKSITFFFHDSHQCSSNNFILFL